MIKKSWLISVALFQKDVLEQKTWLIPSEYLNYTKWKEQCRSCDPPCTTMHYLHKVSGTISDFCNVGQLFSSHPTHPCCVLQLSCLTSQLSSSFVQVTWNQSLACTEVFSSWKSELHIRINLFFLDWHSERHSGFPLSMARLNHVQISVQEEALRETLSPSEADGILFSHHFQWGQNYYPSSLAALGGETTATAPRPGWELLALLQ